MFFQITIKVRDVCKMGLRLIRDMYNRQRVTFFNYTKLSWPMDTWIGILFYFHNKIWCVGLPKPTIMSPLLFPW